MSGIYILDACALTALLKKEKGADKVAEIYRKSVVGEARLLMNKLNNLVHKLITTARLPSLDGGYRPTYQIVILPQLSPRCVEKSGYFPSENEAHLVGGAVAVFCQA